MSKDLTYDEIVEIEKTRPHVVILGAGATMATIPNGDKNGRLCSVIGKIEEYIYRNARARGILHF